MWVKCIATTLPYPDSTKFPAGKQYQPVPELGNSKHLKPYFPDGTKCHEAEDGKEYYCRDQRCVPGKGRGRGARAGPIAKGRYLYHVRKIV